MVLSEIFEITRLPFEAVADYHVHCDYSVDAEGTINEYCEAAIKRGLAEICFTTHFDSNPIDDHSLNVIRINGENKPATIENMAPYVDDVLNAHDKYYPLGLSVKLGVEIGWYEGCEEIVSKLKEKYDFDYILAGLHDLDGICFCCKNSYEKLFSKYTLTKLTEKYFEQLIKATQTNLFDAIAHACYYLRYGRKFYSNEIENIHKEYMGEFFETLKNSDTSLEINTSGIRHGNDHYYPHMPFVNSAKKAGVEFNHIGSDSHHPSQIGLDFEIAVSLIPDAIKGSEA